ncbi:putative S-layer protein [Candidatus Pacearchaeota archaeon]|nr:putative S-layer protein [Candidatus Pacearchaeota archaeon]
MKTKLFTSVILSAFLLTLLANFISAGGPFTLTAVSVPTSVQNNASTFNVIFNMSYTGALPSINVDLSGSAITQGSATISVSSQVTLNKDEPKQITAVVSFTNGQTGSIVGHIHAVPESGTPEDLPFTVTLTTTPQGEFSFCAFDNGVRENPGDLRVSIKNFQVTGFGSNHEWLPFDQVEFDVKVENNGNDDVNSISLEWGIYDKSRDDWVIKPDEAENFDLSNGNDDTYTVKFKIDDKMDEDLQDLKNGNNYVLYVRATGEVDNTNKDNTCASDSQDSSIIIERNFVVLKPLQFSDSISCGDNVTLTGDLWNIGSKDEKSVNLKVVNTELKINQNVDVGDINSFEHKKVDINIPIPETAKQKSYTLTFEVYDENGDIFQDKYNKDDSRTNAILTVASCTINKAPTATVSADLASEAKAGSQLVVKATVTNSGDNQATYNLNAAGHGSWATLVSTNPDTLTLAPGKSGDATFTFNVNKGVSGDQTFNIEVVSNNQLVANQPVSVAIAESKTSLSSIFGNNWYIWLIGALNVILVVVIIVIAVKVAKK